MKQEIYRVDLSISSTISEVYDHFTKANSDKSLDRMFEGLQKKLKMINCSVTDRERTLINVYIAYGRRQEDFDRKASSSEIFSNRRIESIMKAHSKLSPEEQLGEVLRSLEL